MPAATQAHVCHMLLIDVIIKRTFLLIFSRRKKKPHAEITQARQSGFKLPSRVFAAGGDRVNGCICWVSAWHRRSILSHFFVTALCLSPDSYSPVFAPGAPSCHAPPGTSAQPPEASCSSLYPCKTKSEVTQMPGLSTAASLHLWVCVWETEREKGRERLRERQRERTADKINGVGRGVTWNALISAVCDYKWHTWLSAIGCLSDYLGFSVYLILSWNEQ